MTNTKKSQMKISIKLDNDTETGMNSTFKSKRAFMQSALWDFIKENNLGGTVKVQYAPGYNNVASFTGPQPLKFFLDATTEKELVDEFASV